MDESHHFNTSRLIALEIGRSLDPPTPFEKWVVNRGVRGCQRDHFHFSVTVNGIFWYEPALFPVVYKLLRSPQFNMERREALEMMRRCYCEENEGQHRSCALHRTARESYRSFVEPIEFLTPENRDMSVMGDNNLQRYLRENRRAMNAFCPDD
jgi:hypothetical protein